MLTNFFIGLAIGVVARQLVLWWQRSREKVREKLLNLEDYLEHGVLKNKWGIDLPDSWHNTCVSIIDKAVAFVDVYAGSKEFWIKFIKYARTADQAKVTVDVSEALEKIKDKIEVMVPETIPAELRPLYNEFKQETALKISENKMKAIAAMAPHASVKAPETPVPNREQIIEAIKATATANKINEPQKPVTKEDLERLIAASKLRQELLKKS